MKREGTLEEISDGKLYEINDMVKADCLDCKGCSDCCCGMGDTITLDPIDVHRLKKATDKDFNEMLGQCIELNVHEGVITPTLIMNKATSKCNFLNEEGRCDIHKYRPGICRLFPLGRYYENHGHKYFLQINECSNNNRAKIKVSKWIDVEDIKSYEKFADDWHFFILDIQEHFRGISDVAKIKQINMNILNLFYVMPFDNDRLYEQFYNRLENAKKKAGIVTLTNSDSIV